MSTIINKDGYGTKMDARSKEIILAIQYLFLKKTAININSKKNIKNGCAVELQIINGIKNKNIVGH